MSEINAIEKLREALKDCTSKAGEEPYQFDTYWITANACDMLIDEIEREHEQRVAELKGAICERDGRIGSYERRNTELNDALKVICKYFDVSTEWNAKDTARKVLEAVERDYVYRSIFNAACDNRDEWKAKDDELNAELGSGMCYIEERNGDWYCDVCGEMVGTCDTESELCIDGNAIVLWKYCPSCGARIRKKVD